jgi:hypothetical protein
VRRIVDVAPPYRILVDVRQLLAEHRLGLYHSWMASFLPARKLPVGFVRGFVINHAWKNSWH